MEGESLSLFVRSTQMCFCPQYGEREEGVEYPGEERVGVERDGATVCPNLTPTDTSCDMVVSRDGNYTICLTLSNDYGSVSAVTTFDCEL